MQCIRSFLLPAYLIGLLPMLAGAAGTYQYDELGNLQVLTTTTGVHTYTYDEINRLDQESGPTGARDHVYDANGNRSTDGVGTTATYAPNSDRLATVNGTTVSLDAAGNILSDGVNTYTWDGAARLKTVSRGNKLWVTYYYDYKSRRTRKETTSRAPQGAQVVVYHYDLEDRLLAETLADGTPLKTYVWDDGRLLAQLDHATTPPTLLTFDTDHLGTPRTARTSTGTVVWRWDSDGYGTTLPNEDPDGDGKKTVINLRFPGQYFDQESGLHYNWHRYYSPKLGRYLSADPIGVAGGPNMYLYVRGSPTKYVDPAGLDREVIFWSPLPHPGSIFGHVSSRGGNGENQSFGPDGWDKTYPAADQYIDRQTTNNKRTGLGVVVELNKDQDAQYDQCMSNAKSTMSGDDYNGLTNCSSPSQACLIQAGIPISPSILPGSYQQDLLNSGSVKSINWYGSRK
ncbi:RHS repeat-associated core domain-containing protein [Azoarcus sp. KH32C]|uniref:RHS repeat-associated core domain-containing protein n=1 Tax=Azoarcus sp. KH32C TaxID=748247 RepID=UPI0002385C6E|nr:RHS repeat-associated core domain-containing protein [Azoarcus sp. KH32C]BAL27421.1 hypothetical protein AZKH_p0538 [Azoarcus sp. KH32C]